MYSLQPIAFSSERGYIDPEKLNMFNTIYLRLCNLMLDYGSLACSVAAGATFGYNPDLEGAKNSVPWAVGSVLLAGADEQLIPKSSNPHLTASTDEDYHNAITGRNIGAGISAALLAATYKHEYLPGLVGVILAGSLAVFHHFESRRSLAQLESGEMSPLELTVRRVLNALEREN